MVSVHWFSSLQDRVGNRWYVLSNVVVVVDPRGSVVETTFPHVSWPAVALT